MKSFCTVLVALLLVAVTAAGAAAAIRVVASTTDIGSIAEAIGGDNVEVESIVSGKSDPHFVEVLPSYMVKIARATLYLKVGMELDYWSNQLIDGSGNGKLVIVDCSQGIDRLEVPTAKVDASMGDVHAQGNPHYWLDPGNALVMATNIANALKQVDGANSAAYDAGLASFEEKMRAKIVEWTAEAAPIKGMKIITYHNSWPYLAKFLGVDVADFIEPRPGIEPTPSHTADLIELIKADHIKIIGKEPYFSDRTPKAIAKATGAVVVNLPPSVGGDKKATDYFSLMDTLISTLTSTSGAD
jgi:ABC-type Zn uptake system ZnuABC Zn-binding protein ZnuA